MTATELVVLILEIEATLIAAAIMFVLWFAASRRARVRRREGRLAPARAAIAEHLETLDEAESVSRSFERLTVGDLTRLVFEIAPNLGSAERIWLRRKVGPTPLLAVKRSKARSRWWWRRLSASRLFTLLDAEAEIMRSLLRDPHPLVRAQAAAFVAQDPDDSGLRALLEMLSDGDAACRFAARDALMRLGAVASPRVLEAIASPEHPAILALLDVARITATHEYLPVVDSLRVDERPGVREGAARVFRAIGGRDAAASLLPMLADPVARVRETAAEALGFLNHWPAAGAMGRLLNDPVSRVRLAAANALDRFGPPGELLLRNAVARGTPVAATAARRVLDDASHRRSVGVGA